MGKIIEIDNRCKSSYDIYVLMFKLLNINVLEGFMCQLK